MATTRIINDEKVRVNNTEKGEIYSKNFRTLEEEVNSVGTTNFRFNPAKHALFMGGNAYYVGPSVKANSSKELEALACDIQICDSSTDGERWVPCLFISTVGESGSFSFKK